MPSYKLASELEQREIEWTMLGFIPKRQVCLIVGKRGEGKSTFAAWLTAALTTGEYPNRDGTIQKHAPQSVLFNAREDPLHEITLGRLRAAEADMERVVLEENLWDLPKDLGLLRDRVDQLNRDGFNLGAAILDPLIGHFRNPSQGHPQNAQAMNGLITIAKQHNLAFIIPHHFVKGLRSVGTVQAAIGGMGVIQNVPKAIYIFGPDTAGAKSTKALASEKFNYGRPPTSLWFQLEGWEETFRGKLYEMSRLSYLGPIDAKAADIFDACKYDERGSKRTGVQEAAALILDFFQASHYASKDDANLRLARAAELEDAAQKAGVWFSKGTFGRARDQVGVRPILAGELERLLGNEEALFISDRKGWIACLVSQAEPPMYPPDE